MAERIMFVPGQKPPPKPDIDGPGLIKTWSVSTLIDFETCNYRVYLKKVEKVPDTGDTTAMDRGTRLHTLAEEYVNGTIAELPKELSKIANAVELCRADFTEGLVELEGDWGFTADWLPTDWNGPETWGRAKLDGFTLYNDTSAKVTDWKSGKKFGNELKHNFQGMVYTLSAFMRFPALEHIITEFQYIDQGQELVNTYTRKQAMNLMPGVHTRALRLTNATRFPPKPSRANCTWCNVREACEWRF